MLIESDLEYLCGHLGGSWSTNILEAAVTKAMIFSPGVIVVVFTLKIRMV